MKPRIARIALIGIGSILVLATIALFLPVRSFDFVGYDDPFYVTNNPYVQNGLSGAGIAWAFGKIAGTATYWHPVTWLSHMLDCQLFGMNAGAHHLSNVLLHVANVLILFLLLQNLTGAIWRSAIVAAVFAWHPLQVESVAWVTERKNLLSTLWLFLVIWAYARYAKKMASAPAKKSEVLKQFFTLDYLWIFLLFAIGLMSKPMLVTVPCILFLLDFWPLNRISFAQKRSEISENPSLQNRFVFLLLEKIPLCCLSLTSCVITILSHKQLASFISENQISLDIRIANAVLSYVTYLRRIFWPHDLVAIYPYPSNWPVSQFVSNALILLTLTAVAIWAARKRPYILFGWLWFLGTLVPVIGLVQAGSQPMADRFMYVPMIGILILLVWSITEVVRGIKPLKIAASATCAASLAACVFVSHEQLPFWRNSFTLFERALDKTKDNAVAHYNLGYAFAMQGKMSEAKEHFSAALKFSPNYLDAHNNLASALFAEGKIDEALAHYQEALKINPKHSLANYNAGIVLEKEGKIPEAISHFRTAAESDSSNPDARLRLGNALSRAGDFDAAAKEFSFALQQFPDSADVHFQTANFLMSQQKIEEGLKHFAAAVRLKPNFVEARYNYGTALAMSGKLPEAAFQFSEAARLKPDFFEARFALGMAMDQSGKIAEAVENYRETLKRRPDFLPALLNLGWLLAATENPKNRDGIEAGKLASRAISLTQEQSAEAFDLLAAAYADRQKFKEASDAAKRALQLANAAGRMDLTAQIGKRLELYQAGQPFRRIEQQRN